MLEDLFGGRPAVLADAEEDEAVPLTVEASDCMSPEAVKHCKIIVGLERKRIVRQIFDR